VISVAQLELATRQSCALILPASGQEYPVCCATTIHSNEISGDIVATEFRKSAEFIVG
jgi:hypothetical protein